MSTEGLWKQGDQKAALEWLANLDTKSQVALQRSIRTHQALGPVYNAIARTVHFAQRNTTRLSDFAQRLASSGKNRYQQAKEKHETKSAARSERRAEMVSNVKENVANAKQWAGDTRRDLVASGKEAAGKAVAAGKETAAKGSRWFNQKISNGAARASAAFAGIAARRSSPELQGPDLKLPTNLQLAEHLSHVATATTPEQLAKAEANLGKFIDAKRTELQSAQTGVNKAQNLAWALQGSSPAAGAVQQKPAAGQPGQAAENKQGGKHRKPDGKEI
ncbi:hypothetical protein FB561_7319 [Kribbella amoyensis]|uniref:Uncharacterized protein n=1 Tax=Kribbella amoyensis TaxID=996641 RepID=A0A561B3H6_9ACTN|nr:hypothetical protein [Kribbella amoyensis]TWD73430.1 hypothetical protein FB561_7319 [Kribbella amoyensis]